jgi:hypothetical protein
MLWLDSVGTGYDAVNGGAVKGDDAKVVNDHWSSVDLSASDKNFYCFPPIRSRSSKLIFDEDDARRADWCEYWTVEEYLKGKIPFEKCLSVCCGLGSVGRTLLRALQRKIRSVYRSDNVAYEQISEPLKILPLLRQHFDEMDVRYYDGSVLMYALDEERHSFSSCSTLKMRSSRRE